MLIKLQHDIGYSVKRSAVTSLIPRPLPRFDLAAVATRYNLGRGLGRGLGLGRGGGLVSMLFADLLSLNLVTF